MINKSKKNTVFKVTEKNELMNFLIEKMPEKSRTSIKSLLTKRKVFVGNDVVSQYNHPLLPGQTVTVDWGKVTIDTTMKGVSIIYEDDDVLVVEKESGILSIATDNEREKTAYNMLKEYLKNKDPKNKIFVVHRLDRDTSGIMIFAKTEKAQDILQTTWNDSVKERTYVALVEGVVYKEKDTIISYLQENKAFITYSSQNPKEGKKAISHYKVLKKIKIIHFLK